MQMQEKLFAIQGCGEGSHTSVINLVESIEPDAEEFKKAYCLDILLGRDQDHPHRALQLRHMSLADLADEANKLTVQRAAGAGSVGAKGFPHAQVHAVEAAKDNELELDDNCEAGRAQHLEVYVMEARISSRTSDVTLCPNHAKFGAAMQRCGHRHRGHAQSTPRARAGQRSRRWAPRAAGAAAQ